MVKVLFLLRITTGTKLRTILAVMIAIARGADIKSGYMLPTIIMPIIGARKIREDITAS